MLTACCYSWEREGEEEEELPLQLEKVRREAASSCRFRVACG
jgi:hypothetical protein